MNEIKVSEMEKGAEYEIVTTDGKTIIGEFLRVAKGLVQLVDSARGGVISIGYGDVMTVQEY